MSELLVKLTCTCRLANDDSKFADPTNCYSLDVIERAQFVVCLDKAHPQILKQLQSSSSSTPTGSCDLQDSHWSILTSNILHGNGTQFNGCNRWFDHGFQVSYACSILY